MHDNKELKHLRINILKDVYNLYKENFKMLLEDMKED